MQKGFSIQWVFYVLGFVFWGLNPVFKTETLLCVFYSVFVGYIWTMVPRKSGGESLGWKRILPPLFLVLLMMVASRMVWTQRAEVIQMTAMALIHFRIFLLSLSQFKGLMRMFGTIQFALSTSVFLYLFKEKWFLLEISLSMFSAILMTLSSLSILLLKKIPNHESEIETGNS